MSYRYPYQPTCFSHVYMVLFFLLTLGRFTSANYVDEVHRRASIYIDALVSRYGSQEGHTLSVAGIQRLVDRIELGRDKICDGGLSAVKNHHGGTSSTEENSHDKIGCNIIAGTETMQPLVPERICNESQFLCAATKSQNLSNLLRLLGKRDDLTFNKTEFEAILPALVYRFQSDIYIIHNYEANTKIQPTQGQAFLYGFVFSSLVSLISMVGIVILPFIKTDGFMTGLQFLVAMGAGSLFGTAVMILIPHAINLDISHGYLPKTVVFSVAIHLLYTIENIVRYMLDKRKEKHYDVEKNTFPMIQRPEPHGHAHSHVSAVQDFLSGEINTTNTVNSVGWMVIFGDALHNFLDGVAMGAAFTVSMMSGISISLAIICEELPHELADVAILIHSGLKIKKAFFYNFLAALACYVGMVLGIFLGKLTNASPWILASAGGLFLYISLGVIIPDMRLTANLKKKISIHILHGVGLFIGYSIILVLVVFGENISVL